MRNIFIGAIIVILIAGNLCAQTKIRKTYTTTSGEWIFSFAAIDNNGSDKGNRMRFSPVFNFQHWLHIDAMKHLGFYTGFSIRNIGFIYDVPNTSERKKYRTYNLGIPVGLKLGSLSRACFFAGYELEIPFNYKEKTFIDEKKADKFNVWFSKRTPDLMHSLMVGVHFPRGATLKFKYYLTSFFNKEFELHDSQGVLYKPFENFDVHVFYVSLNFTLLKGRRFNRPPAKKAPTYEAYNYETKYAF